MKTAREQRLQNLENNQAIRQERRERILAIKEQKRKRKEEIQNQRLQQQLKRPVRHQHNDPLGLNALSNLLVGHHAGGLLGQHSGLGIHGLHGHKIHGHHGHGIHGDFLLIYIFKNIHSILFLKNIKLIRIFLICTEKNVFLHLV